MDQATVDAALRLLLVICSYGLALLFAVVSVAAIWFFWRIDDK